MRTLWLEELELEDELDRLREENKQLKAMVIELEGMLSEVAPTPCADPVAYCSGCSCGKKEALGGK